MQTTSGSFDFTSGAVTTGTNIVTDTADIVFNMSGFPSAGAYRYVITDDTTDDDLYDAGVVRPSGYDNELFLDVYVINATDPDTGDPILKIDKAILVTDKGSYGETDPGTVTNTKTNGFENDKYYTVDIEVTKIVTGGMGDKTHKFPFTITIENNPKEETNMTYYTALNSGAVSATNDPSVSPELQDGDVFYIYGLNPKATVKVKEENDTQDTYSVTISSPGEDDPWAEAASVGYRDTVEMPTAQAVTTYSIATLNSEVSMTNAKRIEVTNDYDYVSPTGLVLRYGPFVLLLAGAACFFLIGRRRKESEEESDRI